MTYLHRIALVGASWLAVCLLLATPASAQPEGYQEAISAALEEFQGQRYAEAQALFERANEIYPNARALRGIGMAAFEQRDYTASIRALRASLESDERALTPALQESATSLLERSMVFVGRYRLALSPEDTTVTVDGRPGLVIDGELLMNPGRREVRFRAPGHAAQTRSITVEAGEHPLRVDLTPEAGFGGVGGEDGESGSNGLALAGWVTAGTGAGIGAAAIVTGIMAQRQHDELEDQCGGPCPESRRDDIDRGRRLARMSTAFTFVGVAALGAGVTMIILGRSSDDDEDEDAADVDVQVSPIAGRGLAGANVHVAF